MNKSLHLKPLFSEWSGLFFKKLYYEYSQRLENDSPFLLDFRSCTIYTRTSSLGQNQVDSQTEVSDNKWGFIIEPYILFPNMAGNIGLRNLPEVDVDANPGDIFSKLSFGGMLYLEAHNDDWAITSDLLYMDLKQDVTPGTLISSGNINAHQWAWEFAGLYRIAPFLEAGIGGRLNNIQAGLDINRKEIGGETIPISADMSETWVDPIILIRLTGDIKNKWQFQFRGDVGGFGIGSDFAYQAQGMVGYSFIRWFQLTAGYRILGMNYDKGEGENRFRYDMNIFGPMIKLGFNI